MKFNELTQSQFDERRLAGEPIFRATVTFNEHALGVRLATVTYGASFARLSDATAWAEAAAVGRINPRITVAPSPGF